MQRRTFLGDIVLGLPAIALHQLMGASKAPHYEGKARRVLQVMCPGGCSHLDTFDYKPELEKRHGQPMPGGDKEMSFQGANGNLMRSPWKFAQRGNSGKWMTEMLPHLGGVADEMAFLHAMTTKTNTHGPACVMMNTGYVFEGFPSAGAWLSHALGSENDNLPAYVAIPDIRGIPPSGPANWTAGFLPAEHQGIAFNAAEPIQNLKRPAEISEDEERATREFLGLLNEGHIGRYPGNSDLRARVAAYELAGRMQLSAPEVSDLSRESKATHELYGTGDSNPLTAAFAKNCLLARRLLERNVRYVQLYCASRASGVDGLLNWDAHKTLEADYSRHCPILDKPLAGMLKDLRARGMLSDTLVVWTTEFGRMPTHQQGTLGRDHNPDAFTVWMAGAGIKGGVSYGATDDFGRRAAENVTTIHDFWATVLHLMGLDHEKLTYYHNGLRRRLTDVHGHVIREILS
ncbi:MAG: DUF1501 domain-containing protein [Bryobacteraceae bacterium]|nr:DUF1501 domain-containing protein [Bryobacteraceae bacterium]